MQTEAIREVPDQNNVASRSNAATISMPLSKSVGEQLASVLHYLGDCIQHSCLEFTKLGDTQASGLYNDGVVSSFTDTIPHETPMLQAPQPGAIIRSRSTYAINL